MKYNKYDRLFEDGNLTNLTITYKGGRRMQSQRTSSAIYKLLRSFLLNYGITVDGSTRIGEYEVTAVSITPEFDIDNEPILRELYSFSDGRVNIQLDYRKSDEDIGAYAFWYDLKDYSCTFEKYLYGNTEESKRYETLAEMLKAL